MKNMTLVRNAASQCEHIRKHVSSPMYVDLSDVLRCRMLGIY